MNKTEMIEAISTDTGLSKADVSKVLTTLVDKIIADVAAGQQFTIIGFGTFKSTKRAAREGRNPSTGAKIQIAAATLPKFTAGKKFKDAVNAPKPAKKSRARKTTKK